MFIRFPSDSRLTPSVGVETLWHLIGLLLLEDCGEALSRRSLVNEFEQPALKGKIRDGLLVLIGVTCLLSLSANTEDAFHLPK